MGTVTRWGWRRRPLPPSPQFANLLAILLLTTCIAPGATRDVMSTASSPPSPSTSTTTPTALTASVPALPSLGAPGPAANAAAPSPGPASTSQTISMVLRLAGKELDPWTDSKAAQLLAAVGAVLTGDGVTVNGTSARLLHVQASTAADSGKRRRRLAGEAEGSELDSTAAIPSLYTATEVALIQAVLQASYSSSPALIRLVMVDATASGLLATTMRLKGWLAMLAAVRSQPVLLGCAPLPVCCCNHHFIVRGASLSLLASGHATAAVRCSLALRLYEDLQACL